MHSFQALIYWFAFSTSIVIHTLVENDLFLPKAVAFLLALFEDFTYTTLIIYLAVGAGIHYALIKLKTVDLFGSFDEGKVHLAMRIAVAASAASVVGWRISVGAYNVKFPKLANDEEIVVRGDLTKAVMVPLCLASVLTNAVLRTLISLERRKDKQQHRSGPGAPPIPACKFIGFSAFLGAAVFCIFMVEAKVLDEVFRGMVFLLMTTVGPFVVIARNDRFRSSAEARVRSLFPRGIFKNRPSPISSK